MRTLLQTELPVVSGGLIQTYGDEFGGYGGSSSPVPLLSGGTGDFARMDGEGYRSEYIGMPSGACTAVGGLGALATTMIVGSTCAIGSVLVTGGTAVGACGIVGGVAGSLAGTATTDYCNKVSGR